VEEEVGEEEVEVKADEESEGIKSFPVPPSFSGGTNEKLGLSIESKSRGVQD
jgi:hypothetical protein